MIAQQLILIDPPEGTIGLHFTDTQVWACAGCRAVIGDGNVISHRDDCAFLAGVRDEYAARMIEMYARKPLPEPLTVKSANLSDGKAAGL